MVTYLFIINSQSSNYKVISTIKYPVVHVDTQNRLAKSLLKHLKLIARSLLTRANLPMATWKYAISHVALVIHIKPISYHKYSIMQLVFGQ